MGMFDELIAMCPKCNKYNIVQTKLSGYPSLERIFEGDKIEDLDFYDAKGDTEYVCGHCECHLWFTIEAGCFKGFSFSSGALKNVFRIKADLLDDKWMADAVSYWNNEETTHLLTCGFNSTHQSLVYEYGRLKCKDCGYRQSHIPSAVLASYSRKNMAESLVAFGERLKRFAKSKEDRTGLDKLADEALEEKQKGGTTPP